MTVTDANGVGSDALAGNRIHHSDFPFPDNLHRPDAVIYVGRHAGGAYVTIACGKELRSDTVEGHWIVINLFQDKLSITVTEDMRKYENDYNREKYSRCIRLPWERRGEISFPYAEDSLDFEVIEAAVNALAPEIRAEIDGLVEAGVVNPDIRDRIFVILDQAATISQPARTLE